MLTLVDALETLATVVVVDDVEVVIVLLNAPLMELPATAVVTMPLGFATIAAGGSFALIGTAIAEPMLPALLPVEAVMEAVLPVDEVLPTENMLPVEVVLPTENVALVELVFVWLEDSCVTLFETIVDVLPALPATNDPLIELLEALVLS